MREIRDVDVEIGNGFGTVEVRAGKFAIKLIKDCNEPDGISAAHHIGVALLEAAALSSRTRSTVKVGIAGRLPPTWSVIDVDCLRSNAAKKVGP